MRQLTLNQWQVIVSEVLNLLFDTKKTALTERQDILIDQGGSYLFKVVHNLYSAF